MPDLSLVSKFGYINTASLKPPVYVGLAVNEICQYSPEVQDSIPHQSKQDCWELDRELNVFLKLFVSSQKWKVPPTQFFHHPNFRPDHNAPNNNKSILFSCWVIFLLRCICLNIKKLISELECFEYVQWWLE